MIHHHPSDSWLLDYACGNGLSLFKEVLKAHVGVCSTCRRTVLEAEELGGELLGLAGPSDRSLERAPRSSKWEQSSNDDMQPSFAENVGADAYCRDAAVAVETAKEWMSRRQGSALAAT